MNTSTSNAAPAATSRSRAGRSSWVRTLRGESIRFFSLRSSQWTLVSALLSTAALASISTAFWSDGEPVVPEVGHTVQALSGLVVTQVILGVMGALMMASEYSTGSITTTTLAVPTRHWQLTSKAVVLAAAVFPVGLAGGALSFFATGALLDPQSHQVQSIADPDVLASLLGSAVYLTAIALLGLGIGALSRSIASSVAIVTGGIYILPELARVVLPASWYDSAGAYLPSVAGEALWTPVENPDLLSAPMAAITLTTWVVAILLAGGIVMMRRDT
ncbi:MAG TPA: hypothetical protein VK053_24460 [Jiangellaceae bacterium]|nr:hypothetical protein [Jiangellaceae bacterium]